LISERSVNPSGEEAGTARALNDELSSIGMEVKEQAVPKRVNIEATPSGFKHGGRFLFSGHIIASSLICPWVQATFFQIFF